MTAGRRGLLLVLSAPSGAGKTTLARRLLARHGQPGGTLARSVSVTTRPPRPDEAEARDYFFKTEQRFAEMVTAGELLEQAELYGHRYGTPRAFIEERLAAGVDVLLILDAEGRRQLALTHGSDLVSVFLLPPDDQALERRLRGRKGDDEAAIRRRLEAARQEMAGCDTYDFVLVNDHFDETLESLDTILRTERLHREKPER